jgi:hypothetical protein
MELTKEVIRKMMQSLEATRKDELSCGECFDEIDCFVEMELKGKNAAEAMPLVQEHLNRCRGCKDEYETLLTILQEMAD